MTRDSGSDPLPGLQIERTVLAWERTGLSLMVAAALLGRASIKSGSVVGLVVAVVVFVVGLVVSAISRPLHLRRTSRIRARDGGPSWVPLVGVALAAAILGLTALFVTLIANFF